MAYEVDRSWRRAVALRRPASGGERAERHALAGSAESRRSRIGRWPILGTASEARSFFGGKPVQGIAGAAGCHRFAASPRRTDHRPWWQDLGAADRRDASGHG